MRNQRAEYTAGSANNDKDPNLCELVVIKKHTDGLQAYQCQLEGGTISTWKPLSNKRHNHSKLTCIPTLLVISVCWFKCTSCYKYSMEHYSYCKYIDALNYSLLMFVHFKLIGYRASTVILTFFD